LKLNCVADDVENVFKADELQYLGSRFTVRREKSDTLIYYR